MKLLLVVDIGNTHTALGLWDGVQLYQRWRIASRPGQTADEIGAVLVSLLGVARLGSEEVVGAAVSSVVPPLEVEWVGAIDRYIGRRPMVVGKDLRPPLSIRYSRPHELGADRMVNAYAGYRLYGGPLIVVDYGTATTFDCVSPQGSYLGGAIAPGMILGAEALARGTAKLPRIDPSAPPGRAIAQDTEQAIRNGLLWGQVGLTREMVGRIRQELGEEARVVATGGLAAAIAPHCDVIEEVVPDLTLMGLGWLGWDQGKGV